MTGVTSGFTNIGNLIGGTGTDSYTLSGGTLSGAIDGGLTGANTLIADNTANTWTITAADAGSVTGISGGFTNIGNLTGGTGTDSFTLSGGTVSGAIDGGLTGANTLIADNTANTWTISGADAGTVTGITGGFTNIGNLTGGTGTDSYTISGGSLSGAINGGLSGVNSLTGDNLASTWLISAADGGSVNNANGTVSFTNIGNLTGGTGTDSFTLNGGTVSGAIDGGLTGVNTLTADNVTNSWAISGADAGSVTGLTGGFTNISTLIGGSGADTFSFTGAAVLNGPVNGGAGSDTLDFSSYGTAVSASPTVAGAGNVSGTVDPIVYATGDDYAGMENVITSGALSGPNGQTNVWDITGVNAFTLNGTTYSGVTAVLGGDQIDTFTIQDGGQLTGATAIDGGTGANSIISVGNATWTLTGGDAGSIATTAGATSFVNIQTLTGGAGNDSFVLNGGTLSGAINGGLGVNTLTADNLANTWVINAADGGTVTGITGGFTNIGNLIGGTNTDSFTLSGGTLSGSIDGGLTGVNTLTADNVANTWTISGADTGTVTGIGGTFSHIANLTGGSNDDAFTVGASGSVSGLIDGGAQVGSDTLDYSAVTAAVTTKIGTNFTNIESVTGDGINDTLVGADVANTWTVNGANAGTVGTVAFNGFSNLTGGTNTDGFTLSGGTLSGALNGGTGTNTLTGDNVANSWTITAADAGTVTGITGGFTNIGNLIGGTGDDSFAIADAGSLTGSIAGGGQTTSDTLNLSAKLAAVSINQQTATATGINGTYSGIEAVVGNGVNATLTGLDAGEAFNVTAADAGTAGSLVFTSIGNLTGGLGDDSFVIADAGSLTGSIAGGGQTTSDTLNLSAKLAAVSINQQTATATGINGTYSGIEAVVGNGVNATLTGLDAGEAFNVTAADAGTAGSLVFTSIGNLTGGLGDDSFVIADAGSLTGSIAGGGQTTSDTLNLSAKLAAVSINQQTATATGINGTYSGIEAVVGNGVNATLTGLDAGEAFNVTAADAGTAGSLVFTSIGNLTGGLGDDSFVIADAGSLTGSIAGGGQTTSDTLNLSAKLAAVSINQQTATATGINGTYSGIEAVVGNGVNATLTGLDAGEAFNVTAADAGTAGSLVFTSIGNLTGGLGDDSFVIADAGSLTGSIAGGGQTTSDTLNLSAKLAAVSINQQTAMATGINGTYSGIEAVVGNGVNATLTGLDAGEAFNVTAADAGTAGSLVFTSIGNLTGGTGTDSFTLSGGTLSGAIDGGLTGVNTLTADNLTNTWTISGTDAGSVTGVGGGFTNISTLVGGSGADTFSFTGAAVLNGPVNGGAGSDTLDFSSYGTAVSASPTVAGAGNVSGTVDPIVYATGDDYAGMENVITSGALSGPNGQTNVWDITGVNAFTLNGTTYSGVTAVLGGDQIDTFTIQDGGQLTGATAIDGGTGANSHYLGG